MATSKSTSRVERAPASPQELMLTDIANEQYNDYVSRFMPLNAELLDKVHVNFDRDVQPAMGRASADTRIAASGQARKTLQDALQTGARAGSGRSLMNATDDADVLGKATGEAVGGAYRNAYDQEFVGLRKMAAQGRDIQDSSIVSLADAGNRATRAAIANASRSEKSSRSTGSGWDSALSMAAGAAGNALTGYMFGTPAPSWESGVTSGNKTWYGATYYDPANDFNASPGGGFFSNLSSGLSNAASSVSDWASNAFGGSSGGSFFGGSSGGSIYLPTY